MQQGDRPEDTQQRADRPEEVDRAAFQEDGMGGYPLSVVLFVCAAHDEEKAVEYYDPDDPPRCSHGDLMARKPR